MEVLLQDVGGGKGKEEGEREGITKKDILNWFVEKRGEEVEEEEVEEEEEEEEEGWGGEELGCWRGRGGGVVSPMQLRKREEGAIMLKNQVGSITFGVNTEKKVRILSF